MCKQATQTASTLMVAIRPTLVSLMEATGVSVTQQTQVLASFDAAQEAIANWQQGTSAQTAIQALNAFTAVFATLPIPTDAKALEAIISAGVVTIVGVLTANAPAPAPSEGSEITADEVQDLHVAHVASETTEKVKALVPDFKRSIFTSPSKQYKNAWNKAVDKSDPKYSNLKQ